MKKILNFIKAVVTFTIIFLLLGMLFIHRDFLWKHCGVLQAYYYVWQGDENLKKDNFQEAIDNYKKGLKAYPGHAKAHYNLGNIYFWYELYTAQADNSSKRVFKYNKNYNRHVLTLIKEKKQEGDENNAEIAYINATKANHNFINAWINLGLVKVKKYDYNGASEAFINAINAKPLIIKIPFIFDNEASIKYNRAIAYYNLGEVNIQLSHSSSDLKQRENYLLKALNYYKKAYELYPYNYKINYNYALANQLYNRDELAINYYCKAIKVNPFKFEAHYNLGLILREQEKYIAASDELKKAVTLIDLVDDEIKSEYIFRILNTVSIKAAATELSEINAQKQVLYPYPKEGIIADVIVKPTLVNIKQDTNKQKQPNQAKNNNDSTSEEEMRKDFSICYTDANYITNEKEKYLSKPNWIILDKPIEE